MYSRPGCCQPSPLVRAALPGQMACDWVSVTVCGLCAIAGSILWRFHSPHSLPGKERRGEQGLRAPPLPLLKSGGGEGGKEKASESALVALLIIPATATCLRTNCPSGRAVCLCLSTYCLRITKRREKWILHTSIPDLLFFSVYIHSVPLVSYSPPSLFLCLSLSFYVSLALSLPGSCSVKYTHTHIHTNTLPIPFCAQFVCSTWRAHVRERGREREERERERVG